ncbi:hypothetical protein RIF25_08750 [Thermosynechococcaceae cyanobacterium BACA0444]|uniref:Uncharacterized protein n=1 Tax=Pseudocalidococcus azoricus BACA0444 TaxID=2918990 RepID=A0AAE4FSS0_9CYAN|nr:hypothetical protein [Pseudocalidococcus azoricus]MDS3860902.1 hypothetical protein [Pseudocalidococcus azoricus BACA0444]
MILGLEWHGGNETAGDALLVNLTGRQYAILNTYEFLEIVQYKYLEEDTGVLSVSFYPPTLTVIGILPDGQLTRAEQDRV